MGKRKRSSVARTESTKSVMKAYWEEKRAANVATPAAIAGTSASADPDCGDDTPAIFGHKLFGDKFSGGEEDLSDENALLVISVARLK